MMMMMEAVVTAAHARVSSWWWCGCVRARLYPSISSSSSSISTSSDALSRCSSPAWLRLGWDSDMIPLNASDCSSGTGTGSEFGFGSGLGHGARVSLTAAYCVLCACGSVLNALVMCVLVCCKKLRSASNAFIVNGCAADLLLCAVWMPNEAAAVAGGAGGDGDDDDDGGGGGGSAAVGAPLRAFREALLLLGVTVSLLSHSLIAVNRYVLITKPPAAYHALYQPRRTGAMIAGSWLVALGSLLPRLATGCSGGDWRGGGGGGWGESVPTGPVPAATLVLVILLQTAVVLFCYSRIFRRVRSSVKRVSVLHVHVLQQLPCAFPRRDARLGLHVLALCCVFLLGTEPVLWTLALGLWVPVPAAPRASAWILLCSVSASNPLLHTWKNEEFRRSLRAVLLLRGRGSSVGVEPGTVSSIPHLLLRQNSRRAFLHDTG